MSKERTFKFYINGDFCFGKEWEPFSAVPGGPVVGLRHSVYGDVVKVQVTLEWDKGGAGEIYEDVTTMDLRDINEIDYDVTNYVTEDS